MSLTIHLNAPYKSISTLEAENLPNFVVLTGRNGAGKTHLLEALEQGTAEIQYVEAGGIRLFDKNSFSPRNSIQAGRVSNQFAVNAANAFLAPLEGQPPVETAKAIFCETLNKLEYDSGSTTRYDYERDIRNRIQRLSDFAILGKNTDDASFERIIYEQVLKPLEPEETTKSRRNTPSRENSFNHNQAALLSMAMKQSGKLPHELIQQDILRAAHTEGDLISNSISEVFTAYKIDQFNWAHSRIETEHVKYTKLIAQYKSEFSPPWETLREILSEMREAAGNDGLFNFDFSDPDKLGLSTRNHEQFSFTAEMTNRTSNSQYNLDSLSSGEKTLMTLCLTSFNQYLGRTRPRILLLDELDASLHPSMLTALVKTLKTLFVEQGTVVLMTTHSPMTVAAINESAIYRVTRNGSHIDVSPTTKEEAIYELSEGLATIDMGLKIAAQSEAKVTILTEGNNTKHLKRWASLFFPDDVHVFEGLENQSGKSQLFTFGQFLAKMNTNTHFLIVWDCDACSRAKKLRSELPCSTNVTPFAFTKRSENSIAKKGIENNYGDDVLKPYVSIRNDNDGNELGRDFRGDCKTEFADHILNHGTKQDFCHFQELRDIVNNILNSTNTPTP